MEDQVITWLTGHWMWLVAAFYVLEKIVKLTPTKYDDIVVDIIWGGIKKLAGKFK